MPQYTTDIAVHEALQEAVRDWREGTAPPEEIVATLLRLEAEAVAAVQVANFVSVRVAWLTLKGIPYGSLAPKLAA